MKSYNKGVTVGIGISIFFNIFILDIVLETLAHFDLIGPLKNHTYREVAYERHHFDAFAKGISSDRNYQKVTYGNGNAVSLPLAAIYRAEPVLNITTEIIKEVCISSAYYDAQGNPQWGAIIRFKDENLLMNLAAESINRKQSSPEVFGVIRFGANDFMQMGRFKLDDPQNYSAKQTSPNQGDMHIFFNDNNLARISHRLTLLSPDHQVLPCNGQIDMDLYQMNASWQPLPENFSGWPPSVK
mgnify:CR=1 FL=1